MPSKLTPLPAPAAPMFAVLPMVIPGVGGPQLGLLVNVQERGQDVLGDGDGGDV